MVPGGMLRVKRGGGLRFESEESMREEVRNGVKREKLTSV